VVVVDGEILGKPAHAATRAHAGPAVGREHTVLTGICLRASGSLIEDLEATRVRFVSLSPREVAEYWPAASPWTKPAPMHPGLPALHRRLEGATERCRPPRLPGLSPPARAGRLCLDTTNFRLL